MPKIGTELETLELDMLHIWSLPVENKVMLQVKAKFHFC